MPSELGPSTSKRNMLDWKVSCTCVKIKSYIMNWQNIVYDNGECIHGQKSILLNALDLKNAYNLTRWKSKSIYVTIT